MPKKKIITPDDPHFYDEKFDEELFMLEELLQEEMYEKSEKSLYQFFINFWNTFDPQPLVNNWHIECLCEHIQAALNRKIRRLIINIPPRSCLPASSQIQLKDGSFIAIKDIEAGMGVISTNGKTLNKNKVLDKWSVGLKKVIRLKFNDGNYLDCTPEHKILTPEGFVKAGDLSIYDIVYSHSVLPINPTVNISLEDAFLLGLWVAQGVENNRRVENNRTEFAFTSNVSEIVNKATAIIEAKGWQYINNQKSTHCFIDNQSFIDNQTENQSGQRNITNYTSVSNWFESYTDCSKNSTNRIPSCILKASREAKIEFLNVFIACKGYIYTNSIKGKSSNKVRNSNKIIIELTNEQLAKDIYRLLKQLGYTPTLRQKLRHKKYQKDSQDKVHNNICYCCIISSKKDLMQAASEFNLYHKQPKLLSIVQNLTNKPTTKLNDKELPTKYLTSNNAQTKRLKKYRFTSSTILTNDRYHYAYKEQYLNGLRFSEIIEIQELGEQECFDIEVENDHTFFAEGIAVSNSKSTTASITAPVWWWINHPQEKFWLASHSERLFMQNIIYARRILEHPLYKDRWCNPENEDYFRYSLAADSNTKKRIDNDMNGYILGCSPTSKVLGTGYTVAVLDDILDSEESNNPNLIKGVNDWFTQTFLNRSNDVNNDVIIIVMQRLAENDLTGYVMETYSDQDWFLLNLPAKYIPEKTFVSPINFNDVRTKRNELLDPQRLPDSFLAAQAKNPIIYNTRYQQNPGATTDGNLIKEEWLIETANRPLNYTTMITVWDLSFNESPTSSYTVGLVLCKMDDKYYIVDMYRAKCSIPEQLDAIRKLKQKYPKSQIGIEAKANGHAAMSLLEREITNIYSFDPRKFGGSKEQRLGSVLTYFRDKKVLIYNPFIEDSKLEPTYDISAIKNELKAFPTGSSDDIVDCVAYGIQYLAEYGSVSVGFITNGAKIRLSDDDWTRAKFKEMGINYESIDKLDYNTIEIFSELPSMDSLKAIEW